MLFIFCALIFFADYYYFRLSPFFMAAFILRCCLCHMRHYLRAYFSSARQCVKRFCAALPERYFDAATIFRPRTMIAQKMRRGSKSARAQCAKSRCVRYAMFMRFSLRFLYFRAVYADVLFSIACRSARRCRSERMRVRGAYVTRVRGERCYAMLR